MKIFTKIPYNRWDKNRKRKVPCNMSGMKISVSSPDETLTRELKIRRAAVYFWRTSRCSISWWNIVSNAWYSFSNKIILEEEIKDAKMSSFSSDFQTLIKHSFPLYFLYALLMSLRSTDSVRFTQLWSKHCQFREYYFILNHKKSFH